MRMTIRNVSAWAMLALTGAAAAQDSGSAGTAPYCPDLKQLVAIAATNNGFQPIAGVSRQGNYAETKLTLARWNDCLLYGTSAYTCDSPGFKSGGEAQYEQAGVLRDIQACLGSTWREVKARSSPSYVVLHDAAGPISITLSADETDQREHVVRLTIFVRRN